MTKPVVKYYKAQLLSLLEEIHIRSNRNSVFILRDDHKPFDTKEAFLSLYRFLYEFEVCQKWPSGGGERFKWLNPQEPKEILDSVVYMLAEQESHFECVGDVPEPIKSEESWTGDRRRIGFETNEDKILEYALEKEKEFKYSEICEDLKERVHEKSISAILSTLTKTGTLVRIKNGVYVHSNFSKGQTSVFSPRKDEVDITPLERSIVTIITDNGSMTLKDLYNKLGQGQGLHYATFQQRLVSLCNKKVLKKLDRGIYGVFKDVKVVEPKAIEPVVNNSSIDNSPIDKEFRTKLGMCLSQIDALETSISEKKASLEIEEKMLKDEKAKLEVMLSMKHVYMN